MRQRFARQIMLPEVGEEGQERIGKARVLIVGIGGLGSPAALYLAAAGVGRMGIIDADVVSVSNLHRQVLYTTADVGKYKVHCAQRRLQEVAPDMCIDTYCERLTADNSNIISQYDIVVDGCDNAATRYLIDEACARNGIPYLYAAITSYAGQLTLFDARSNWRYCHLFPDKEYALAQPAVTQGVMGALPGVMGAMQAAECIKYILRLDNTLLRRLFTMDILTMQSDIIEL